MASPGSAKKYHNLPRRLLAHDFNNPIMISGMVQRGDDRGFSTAFCDLASFPPGVLMDGRWSGLLPQGLPKR
jgi:hypothetical protein